MAGARRLAARGARGAHAESQAEGISCFIVTAKAQADRHDRIDALCERARPDEVSAPRHALDDGSPAAVVVTSGRKRNMSGSALIID